MPWEKNAHNVKMKKQDTVAYMQYDLNYEIILILIHRKKDWKKMHQTFNCMWDHKIFFFFLLFGNFQIL